MLSAHKKESDEIEAFKEWYHKTYNLWITYNAAKYEIFDAWKAGREFERKQAAELKKDTPTENFGDCEGQIPKQF